MGVIARYLELEDLTIPREADLLIPSIRAGRRAEQNAINREGGVDKLDNKRNEIRPKDWKKNNVNPPK